MVAASKKLFAFIWKRIKYDELFPEYFRLNESGRWGEAGMDEIKEHSCFDDGKSLFDHLLGYLEYPEENMRA
jgi:hypothetical protein